MSIAGLLTPSRPRTCPAHHRSVDTRVGCALSLSLSLSRQSPNHAARSQRALPSRGGSRSGAGGSGAAARCPWAPSRAAPASRWRVHAGAERLATSDSGERLERMAPVYEAVYQGLDRDVGCDMAEKSHKDCPRVPGDGWFYSELSWEGMHALVGLAEPQAGEVLVDLGSGLGKMVLSTAMTRLGMKECRGVEILPELAEQAAEALARLECELGPDEFAALPTMSLVEGDLFAADLSDVDIVYFFATCFPAEVMQAVIRKLETEMKPGARLLIVSKEVQSPAFLPWKTPYASVGQAHSRWNLDGFLYVHI